MARSVIALVALAAFAGPAAATPQQDFARYVKASPQDVTNVAGHAVRGAGTVTRVIYGQQRTRWGATVKLVIVICNPQRCWDRTYFLGEADSVRVTGLIDLAGPPVSLTSGALYGSPHHYHPLRTGGKGWPVLVLRTSQRKSLHASQRRSRRRLPRVANVGPSIHEQLILVSLRWKDWNKAVVLRKDTRRRGHAGYGQSAGFRLVRGQSKILDVEETRRQLLRYRSRCKRPKPITVRHVWAGSHYVQRPGAATFPPSRCH